MKSIYSTKIMNDELEVHDFGEFKVRYSDSEIRRFIKNDKIDGGAFYDFLVENNRLEGEDRTNGWTFVKKIATTAFDNITLNTGGVVSLNDISDKQQAAKAFAEGNADLERLLNSAWNIGLETFACCAGHEEPKVGSENGISKPYVSFCINENFDIFIKLADIIANKGYKFFYSSSDGKDNITFIDHNFDLTKKTEIFNDILNSLKLLKKNDLFIQSNLLKIMSFIHDNKKLEGSFDITLEQEDNHFYCTINPDRHIRMTCNYFRDKLFEQGIIYKDGLITIEGNSRDEIEQKSEILFQIIYGAIASITDNIRCNLDYSDEEKEYRYKELNPIELANLINYGTIFSLNNDCKIYWFDKDILNADNDSFVCQLPTKNNGQKFSTYMQRYSLDNLFTIDDLSAIYIGGNRKYNFLEIIKKLHSECISNGKIFVNPKELLDYLKEELYSKETMINYLKELKKSIQGLEENHVKK